ncbi:hypothetical protein KR093_009101 [Drosophila rubida]|uniref:Filamin-A n=1 Tax=Drosophila rubida TaxID=30044 RepID=A0AAD4JWA1_9MUSC|nr:hypothetical protein KR093_009101 [Drosophila rubida]
MFKVSQEMRLNTNATSLLDRSTSDGSDGNSSESACIFGRYQRTPDADAYPTEPPHVYVAPELTDAVRLENPSGQHGPALQLEQLDPERFQVQCQLQQAGLYKVHIKCNSVPLPKSPYIIVTIAGATAAEATAESAANTVPVFQSDASQVQSRGLGLSHISLLERNEFTVDASAAGSNMLFVAIAGPRGPSEEILVRHLGRHVYRVMYQVRDPGNYHLVAKWGEQHIPGSPFSLISD